MSVAAVEVRELHKSYAGRKAVDGISFDLRPGGLLALLGTNGAGKTTTVEICEGFRNADSGTVRILGCEPTDPAVRPRVGVMLQDGVGGYTGARAKEMLDLFASYAAHPVPTAELLGLVGLTDVADRPVRRLSGGQQQRLSLAMALVGRPELLFLDEPTTGMDPHARHATWDLVRQLRDEGVSVVLTTHYLDEAEELADDVIVLHQGRIVAHGSPSELTRADAAGTIRFSARPGLDVLDLAGQLAGAAVSEPVPGEYLVRADVTPELLAAVTGWCARQDVLAEGLSVERRSLEQVFMELTGPAGSTG